MGVCAIRQDVFPLLPSTHFSVVVCCVGMFSQWQFFLFCASWPQNIHPYYHGYSLGVLSGYLIILPLKLHEIRDVEMGIFDLYLL